MLPFGFGKERKGNILNCTEKSVRWVGNFGRVTVKLHARPKCVSMVSCTLFCCEFILAMFAAYLPQTQQGSESSMSTAVVSILFLLNVCFK